MLHDKGSERAVLAGICRHSVEGYFEVCDILSSNVFTDSKNQMIYECLEYMFIRDIKKVDIAGLFSAANSLKYEDEISNSKEDKEFVRSLFNFPIGLENLRSFAVKIVNLKIARDAQSKLQKSYQDLNSITGDEDTDKIISIAESPYLELMKELVHTDEDGDIGEDIDEYINNKIENPVKNVGIPGPFPLLNSVIGDGFRTGVHLIAARFKVGKSSFAKEIGLHIAKNLNIPVLYIDTEMQADEQKDRILASLSDIPIRKIEKGDLNKQEIDKIRYVSNEIKGLKFQHKRVSGKSFQEILSIMKRWINHKVGYGENGKANPHYIIYDYFKLMDTAELKNIQEYQAMGFQIASLHDFCAENNSPVLSFVQTNRDGISKDTTDVISQSDRLGWNCISLSILKRKTPEEKGQERNLCGTHKVIPLEGRFMQKLDDGDWINYYFDEAKSKIKELGRRYESRDSE